VSPASKAADVLPATVQVHAAECIHVLTKLITVIWSGSTTGCSWHILFFTVLLTFQASHTCISFIIIFIIITHQLQSTTCVYGPSPSTKKVCHGLHWSTFAVNDEKCWDGSDAGIGLHHHHPLQRR